MIKSKLSKLLTVILALFMLFSMAACGSGTTTQETQTTVQQQSVASTETTQAAADPMAKYDPAITVNMAYTPDTNIKYPEGDSATDNTYLRGYKDELGININYLWQTTSDMSEQKLDLAIASGDIPDIMYANAKQFDLLLKEDLIQPLDEAYDKYTTPLAKQILSEDGGATLETGKRQGKLMGITGIPFAIESCFNLWIRQDWLTKLGLPEPKTFNDVVNIADAFVNKDPDGNNKKDTVGFLVQNSILVSNNVADIDGILAAHHAYMNIWQKDASGNLVYSGIQPEMKAGLAELQKLVKDGLISKEFSLTDGNKMAELVTSGKAGIEYGAWWNEAWPLNGAYDKDQNAEWKAYPLLSADDQPTKPWTTMGGLGYYVVRKGYEHPEALAKLINFFVEKAYGGNPEDAKKYQKTTNGTDEIDVYKEALVVIWRGDENVNYKIGAMTDALKNNDPSKLTEELKNYYDQIQKFNAGDKSTVNWVAMHHYGPGSALPIYVDWKNDRSKIMVDEFYGSQTPTMAAKWETLKKLQSENIYKIMLGADLSEFDKFVENWKSLGGDQITSEVNDWYKSTQ